MKGIVFSVLMVLAVVANVHGQGTKDKVQESPQSKAKKATAKMSTAAGISGEQVAKVNQVYLDFFTKRDAIKADKKLSETKADDKLDELKDERDKQLKAILTPQQWKLWKEYREKQKDEKR